MKTTLFFLFLCVFSLFAENVYPQRVLPSLNMKDITLKEVFSVIEKESDYLFLVTDEISAELKTKVTLTSGNKMISEVMDQLLRDTGLTYIITGRQVAVYRNTEEQKAAVTQQEKRQITGTVLDAQTKEPVIGANVWIKESTVGAITNADGKYTIPVTGNTGILVFSFIGYQQQEAPIGNNRTIDVLLEESRETSLDEVVVVAYGRQKKESVIGAISTIDVARLKTPTSKISNILAGQLAGVIGFNRSGEPGEGSTFYIRGISTFGSTKTPLVLVDGIERSLDLVDPEDIESFSILKDATATAVYGVRGANGVLLVTTRKGVEGKPRITVRAEAGIVGPTRMPKAVNSAQLAELYNEAYGYDNNGAKRYSDEVIRKFKDGSDPDLYPNTDWIGSLYNDWATNQRANVNISGGGTLARYYVAGSIYNEGSIYKEDKKATGYNSSVNFNKVNFRANLDLNLTPSTVLNINLANVYEKKNSPGRSTSDIWSYSFHTAPYAFPLKYSDGKLAGPTAGTGYNPYNILIYSGYKEEWWNNAQALVGITQDFSDIITPGLKASVKFSWDALSSNSITRGFTPQQYRAYSRDEATGELEYQETNKGQESLGFEKGNSGNRVTYLEASVTYDRLFNEIHRVGALFLYNQKEKNNIAPGNNLESLPYRNQGVAGRMTYSYRDKYFAEFNIGYNGSENFSPGRRFGVFPAGAIGWLISNEDFWEPYSDVVDVLKLRASYGIVGNDQIGGSRRFIYEATMKTTDVPSYEFNNSPAIPNSAIQVGEVANPNVGWEEATKTNIGLELALYRNLRIQADYFYEKREGIFLQRASMPDYVGITTQPWVNVGKMKNQGFDGSLEFDRKVGEVMLTSRANFTYTHNTILNNDQPDYLDPYRSRVGKRLDQYFGLQAIGFFRSQEEIDNSPAQFGILRPGDVKYKDINGDGVVDTNDETAIGYSAVPEIVYGFGATAQWKGIDFSFFFQGVDRVSIQISAGDISFKPFSSTNADLAAVNSDVYEHRWTESNRTDARYPRVSLTNSPNNNVASTLWLHNGAFLRLKNVELGYTLPKKLVARSFLNSVRLYATGINLLTFSRFKLWDPERGSGAGAAYPPNRTISFGVNITI